MNKFRIGQKVKFRRPSGSCWVGRISYVSADNYAEDAYCIQGYFNSPPGYPKYWDVQPNELELVEPGTAIQVITIRSRTLSPNGVVRFFAAVRDFYTRIKHLGTERRK